MKFKFISKTLNALKGYNSVIWSNCKKETNRTVLKNNDFICPHCNTYIKMSSIDRINYILEDYEVISGEASITNPIDFPNYKESQEKMKKKSGMHEAVMSAVGMIKDEKVVVCAMDANYFMGSMGSFVGEEIANTYN